MMAARHVQRAFVCLHVFSSACAWLQGAGKYGKGRGKGKHGQSGAWMRTAEEAWGDDAAGAAPKGDA